MSQLKDLTPFYKGVWRNQPFKLPYGITEGLIDYKKVFGGKSHVILQNDIKIFFEDTSHIEQKRKEKKSKVKEERRNKKQRMKTLYLSLYVQS